MKCKGGWQIARFPPGGFHVGVAKVQGPSPFPAISEDGRSGSSWVEWTSPGLGLTLELEVVEPSVEFAVLEQFLVAALFDDAAVV